MRAPKTNRHRQIAVPSAPCTGTMLPTIGVPRRAGFICTHRPSFFQVHAQSFCGARTMRPHKSTVISALFVRRNGRPTTASPSKHHTQSLSARSMSPQESFCCCVSSCQSSMSSTRPPVARAPCACPMLPCKQCVCAP